MVSLEELQEKFDNAQKVDYLNGAGLAALIKDMDNNYIMDVKTFVDKYMYIIESYNIFLEEKGLPVITQEDLEFYHGFLREKYIKNLYPKNTI